MFGDTKYVFMGFCLDCDIAFECEHLQQYFMLKEKWQHTKHKNTHVKQIIMWINGDTNCY